MTHTLTIRDETSLRPGRPELVFVLACPEESLTVRELIRARVQQEVEAYNQRLPEFFHGLVQPTDAERTLNGYRMPTPRRIDPAAQCARALEAFETNGFLMLVNDRQVESLDETVTVRPETTVTFFKLVPLVGG